MNRLPFEIRAQFAYICLQISCKKREKVHTVWKREIDSCLEKSDAKLDTVHQENIESSDVSKFLSRNLQIWILDFSVCTKEMYNSC